MYCRGAMEEEVRYSRGGMKEEGRFIVEVEWKRWVGIVEEKWRRRVGNYIRGGGVGGGGTAIAEPHQAGDECQTPARRGCRS